MALFYDFNQNVSIINVHHNTQYFGMIKNVLLHPNINLSKKPDDKASVATSIFYEFELKIDCILKTGLK